MIDPSLLVRNPLQYLDGEVNAVRKDFDGAAATVALVFPDLYELGMSHMGLKILYEILNGREEFLAERAFAPDTDREEQIRAGGTHLSSLESGRPLRDFDLLGFTLPYEMTFTNILNIIDLAGIPVHAKERGDEGPLVAGGGPCAHNPEPLADFFDFFLLGDGEEAITEIADVVARSRGESRREKLRRLARVRGVYVPSFYEPRHDGAGRLTAVDRKDGAPAALSKRILLDLDAYPHPSGPPVSYLETTHDRVTVEIARGCIQRCRFCQAGVTYRPYRERSPASVLSLAARALAATGCDELSLAALSCGDYRHLEPLLAELMSRYSNDRISISLPSLRPGTISEGVLREIRKVRRTGFTIAPEAGSQRLRDVISKGVTDEQILQTCERLFKAGWNRVKLYFMVGLPTETEEDRQGIVDMTMRIRSLGKKILGRHPAISASVSSFVPKPHTPFQWERQMTPAELHPILNGLRGQLRRRGVSFKWHHPELSALEGAISRGGRFMGSIIHEAWRRGRTFDGWTDRFEFEPWLEAFRQQGRELEDVIGTERQTDTVLPWDHLAPRELRDFLRAEQQRALAAAVTEACDPTDCPSCGQCEDYAVPESADPVIEHRPTYRTAATATGKVRVEFAKFGTMKYLPHLALMRTFHRALRRAGIPVAYSQGHTPHPRIQLGPPLPLGYEGDREYVDIEIHALISPAELAGKLGAALPPGLEVRRAVAVPLRGASLFEIVTLQTYRIVVPKEHLPGEDGGNWLLARILEPEHLYIERTRKGRTKTVDLRPAVARAEIIGESETEIELVLDLHRKDGSSPRPGDVLRRACDFAGQEEFEWKITRTANLTTTEEPPSSPMDLPPTEKRKKVLSSRR